MESAKKKISGWLQAVVWTLRVVIGGVFVVSGTTKCVDIWGFVFKLEEYLEVWNLSEPRSLVILASVLISAYELVFGFLLLTGCYKRVAPWILTASMVVMLPLTAYIAVANPVSDCGCFGDFWVISNTATFVKNIFLTAGLVVLIIYNRRVKEGLFEPAIQWIVGGIVTLYACILALYGYNVQPMLDFRSYPAGSFLTENEEDDSSDAMPTFIYEKDGEQKEFTADELPDDSWTFVERKDAGDTGDMGFSIYDGDEDVTDTAIEPEGKELLLVIPEPRMADISYTYYINGLYEKADSAGIAMIGLIGGTQRDVAFWKDISMAAYPCYTAEDTGLKELSRGIMSLVLLEDGQIVGKATVSSIAEADSDGTATLSAVSRLENSRHFRNFWILTGIFGGVLLLIYLFQGIILVWRAKFRKRITVAASENEAAANSSEPIDVLNNNSGDAAAGSSADVIGKKDYKNRN